MSFTDDEIREDYMEKIRQVFTSGKGRRKVVTAEMCRIAAEKGTIKKNSVAKSMQRRIERVFTDPSGKEKPTVVLNRPRITKTFNYAGILPVFKEEA